MPKSALDMASKCGNRIRNRISRGVSTEHLWERLGWSPVDLAKHLERHFYNDMSWDNFASWDIDHTIPLRLVKGATELNPFYSEEDIKEFQERLEVNQDSEDVKDNILNVIEDHKLLNRVWSVENLRPLFKVDHIMKSEFEAYLINRNAKADEYFELSDALYKFYGKSKEEREERKIYHQHHWPERWIREINKEIKLSRLRIKTSSWSNFHGFEKQPKLCKGLTDIGHPCSYKAMNDDDRCYLHTNKQHEKASDEDLEILKNMLIHVPTLPSHFFSTKLENSKSRFPSERRWKYWINEFPINHKMLRMYERKHYNLEKTEIASMLIRYCTPGINSINTLLRNNGLDLTKNPNKSKWQKFWTAHGIVLDEFKDTKISV